MAVVTKFFDPKLIPFHVFENARSYEAAVLCVELLNKFLKFQREGYVVLDNGHVNTHVFDVTVSNTDFQMSRITSSRSRILFVGDVHGGPNCDKVYLTKKVVREWWNQYRFVRKSHIKNLLKAGV